MAHRLLLNLLGTLAASVGNLVSAILQKRDLNVWNSTAFGMMYGTAITFMFALINGILSNSILARSM